MNKLIKITPFKPSGFVVADESELLSAGSISIGGACVDSSGVFYFSDSSVHAIFSIDQRGAISVFAGSPGESGDSGGSLKNARFNAPAGLAVDKSGAVYVADSGNNKIRVIRNNTVYTLFGGSAGFVNGTPENARLKRPTDVCVDLAGNLYVADTGNHSIRAFNGQYVSTLAGNGTSGDSLGLGSNARFNGPSGVAIDISGRLYIADSGNRKIKIVDPNLANVCHFCGSGDEGDSLGGQHETEFRELREIFVDKSGFVFVLSRSSGTGTGRIVKINGNGYSYSYSQLDILEMEEINGLTVSDDGTVYVSVSSDVGLESSQSSQSNNTSSDSSGSSNSSGSSVSSRSSGSSVSTTSSLSTESSESTNSSQSTTSSWSSWSTLSSTSTDSSQSSTSSPSSSPSSSTEVLPQFICVSGAGVGSFNGTYEYYDDSTYLGVVPYTSYEVHKNPDGTWWFDGAYNPENDHYHSTTPSRSPAGLTYITNSPDLGTSPTISEGECPT